MKMLDDCLFSRLKTLNATGAVDAVKASLDASNAKDLLEQFSASFLSETTSKWAALGRALEKLDAAQTEENLHIIDNMQGIIALCWKRAEEEADAADAFQDEKAFALWHKIEHLQATTIKPWLKKWIELAGLTAEVDSDALTAVYGRWWGLVQAVRAVQEFSWTTPPEPAPAIVETVLLYMIKRKKAPEAEADIFGKCELCWRFVPLAFATGHNHLYCQIHQWNTLEYKRALKVHAEATRFNATMDTSINRLHKQSLKQWVAYHHNLPVNWTQLFRDDIIALADAITCPMEYSMDLLRRYFPKVCAVVEKENIELTPASIVHALDPIPDGLKGDMRVRWDALHHVFAQNFALFRRELCHAEVFLSIYNRLFANVKRGGARLRKQQGLP